MDAIALVGEYISSVVLFVKGIFSCAVRHGFFVNAQCPSSLRCEKFVFVLGMIRFDKSVVDFVALVDCSAMPKQRSASSHRRSNACRQRWRASCP